MTEEIPAALTSLHVDVARLFFSLSEGEGYLLAGGAALVAQGLTHRPTQDLDIFTSPGHTPVPEAFEAFTVAANRSGWDAAPGGRRP